MVSTFERITLFFYLINLFNLKFLWSSQHWSKHFCDESADIVTTVPPSSTVDVWVCNLPHATLWWSKLERPKEIISFFKVWTTSNNLMNQVLHADYSVLPQLTLNDFIACDWNSLSINLSKTTLVKQVSDIVPGWISPCHSVSNKLKHLNSGLIEFDESCIMDLS